MPTRIIASTVTLRGTNANDLPCVAFDCRDQAEVVLRFEDRPWKGDACCDAPGHRLEVEDSMLERLLS